ncbi:MAG: hypothetical protein V7K97_18745 [Nostoc sp.]|uniref:WD40 repeat domain-containing protein n=1 Tax=Nostoc sp. TaxID=1180 RepID=UPI002FF5BB3A
MQDHEGSVTAIAFSPDGQKIVSASIDNTVRLWYLAGNPIAQPFWGHENYVWSVAFSPRFLKLLRRWQNCAIAGFTLRYQ